MRKILGAWSILHKSWWLLNIRRIIIFAQWANQTKTFFWNTLYIQAKKANVGIYSKSSSNCCHIYRCLVLINSRHYCYRYPINCKILTVALFWHHLVKTNSWFALNFKLQRKKWNLTERERKKLKFMFLHQIEKGAGFAIISTHFNNNSQLCQAHARYHGYTSLHIKPVKLIIYKPKQKIRFITSVL